MTVLWSIDRYKRGEHAVSPHYSCYYRAIESLRHRLQSAQARGPELQAGEARRPPAAVLQVPEVQLLRRREGQALAARPDGPSRQSRLPALRRREREQEIQVSSLQSRRVTPQLAQDPRPGRPQGRSLPLPALLLLVRVQGLRGQARAGRPPEGRGPERASEHRQHGKGGRREPQADRCQEADRRQQALVREPGGHGAGRSGGQGYC